MKNKLNILTALLGIVLGVVVTMTFSKVMLTRRFDGDYNRWRKLNLILQEVQMSSATSWRLRMSPSTHLEALMLML